jgi:hypothetical protein
VHRWTIGTIGWSHVVAVNMDFKSNGNIQYRYWPSEMAGYRSNPVVCCCTFGRRLTVELNGLPLYRVRKRRVVRWSVSKHLRVDRLSIWSMVGVIRKKKNNLFDLLSVGVTISMWPNNPNLTYGPRKKGRRGSWRIRFRSRRARDTAENGVILSRESLMYTNASQCSISYDAVSIRTARTHEQLTSTYFRNVYHH